MNNDPSILNRKWVSLAVRLNEASENFVKENLKIEPNADKKVLKFIAEVLYHGSEEVSVEHSSQSIHDLFRAGFCWHFAHMLKTTFRKGKVCWAAPFGHFVWVYKNIPYDIEGIYDGEADHYIPESFLGQAIKDFTHNPSDKFGATKEQIQEIIDKYLSTLEGAV